MTVYFKFYLLDVFALRLILTCGADQKITFKKEGGVNRERQGICRAI